MSQISNWKLADFVFIRVPVHLFSVIYFFFLMIINSFYRCFALCLKCQSDSFKIVCSIMFNYGKLAHLQLVWGASMYIFYSVLIYMANFSFLKFRMQVKKSNVIFLFLSQSCFDCCKNIFS